MSKETEVPDQFVVLLKRHWGCMFLKMKDRVGSLVTCKGRQTNSLREVPLVMGP
jgi:hypothetical protein